MSARPTQRARDADWPQFIDMHIVFIRGEPFLFISEEARRALVGRR